MNPFRVIVNKIRNTFCMPVLVKQDELLAKLNTLYEKFNEANTKQDNLAAKQDALAEKQDALATKQDALAAKQDTLVAKQDTLVAKQAVLAAKQDALAAKQDILIDKLNSFQLQNQRMLGYLLAQGPAKELLHYFCRPVEIQKNIYINQKIDFEEFRNSIANWGKCGIDARLLREMEKERFKFNHSSYILNKRQDQKKRRIFLTTGSVSLINSLSYIAQFGEQDKYNDVLFIMGNNNETFINNMIKMAEVHAFEKIYFSRMNGFMDSPYNSILFFGLYDFDEVVYVHHIHTIPIISELYTKAKLIQINEGAACFACIEKFHQPIEFSFIRNYFGCIDNPYPENGHEIKYMEKEIMLEQIKKVRKHLNLKIQLPGPGKWILFCGTASDTLNCLKDKSKCENFQLDLIKSLQEKGYKVMFKQHPRLSAEPYKKLGVELLDVTYPLELYDLSEFVAVASIMTGALLTFQDMDLPAFKFLNEEEFSFPHNSVEWNDICIEKVLFIYNNYIMNGDVLLEVDQKLSSDELKKYLRQKQINFLASKTKLSQNEKWKTLFPFEKELDYKGYKAYTHYDFVFNGRFVILGEDKDGCRTLYKGGRTFGPYIYLNQGKYMVYVKGENLKSLSFSCWNDANNVFPPSAIYDIKQIKVTDEYTELEFYVNDDAHSFEFCVENSGEQDVKLYQMTLNKVNE